MQRTKSSLAGLLSIFVLVLLISFVYHLPAGWVFKQMNLQSQLPKNLHLSEPQGTLWQGQTQLTFSPSAQSVFSAKLEWQLSPWSLLMLQPNLAMSLDNAQGGSKWNIATGLLDQSRIEVSDLNGMWQLTAFQAFLPNSVRGLGELKGQVGLLQLGLVWDVQTGWLASINGSAQFSQADFLGANIPQLKVEPALKNKQVELSLDGGGPGWKLSGSSLMGPKAFQHNLKIQADNAQSMPDWIDLVMRKKTPVLATLVQKGRW
ncbi:type II secretion system protein N [Thiomicrorhabdus sp.]|uniref:type II secretion system protein N n=1 Tax=Thiomicrorhabdus sp. TaxID=2039724 RepID=UPI0035644B64